jgi:hypothetical protein
MTEELEFARVSQVGIPSAQPSEQETQTSCSTGLSERNSILAIGAILDLQPPSKEQLGF